MVRNYKRKTKRANWSEDQMKLAISAVKHNEMSLCQTATAYTDESMQSPINVASPSTSHSNNVTPLSIMPTATESHHVPNTEPCSADVCFSDIQKVPSIPEKQKSK